MPFWPSQFLDQTSLEILGTLQDSSCDHEEVDSGIRYGDVMIRFEFPTYGGRSSVMVAILRPVAYADVPGPEMPPQAQLIAIRESPDFSFVMRSHTRELADINHDLVMSGFTEVSQSVNNKRPFRACDDAFEVQT